MSGYLIYCVEKSVIGLITAYLAYKSVANKSVEDSVEARKSILSLFIFFGLFTIIESTIEPFLFWLPFYYEAKCVILLIVSVLSLYYHSLFLNRVILDPLFQQFDVHVAPRLVKYTNDLLYYAVVIVSPFVSYAQLERMEEYILSAKKAMYGDSAATIANCSLCSTNPAQIGYSVVSHGLPADPPSADHSNLRSRWRDSYPKTTGNCPPSRLPPGSSRSSPR